MLSLTSQMVDWFVVFCDDITKSLSLNFFFFLIVLLKPNQYLLLARVPFVLDFSG
jgi:hypothetical protein